LLTYNLKINEMKLILKNHLF